MIDSWFVMLIADPFHLFYTNPIPPWFWPTAATDWADLAQSLATVAALIVAGVLGYLRFGWFRTTQPQATISHSISHRLVGHGLVHLAVGVDVTNTSKVMIEFRNARLNIWNLDGADTDELKKRAQESDEGKMLMWPNVARRRLAWGAQAFIVEPGEKDCRLYEFLIQDHVKSIAVDSYYWNYNVVRPEGDEDPHDSPRRRNLFRQEAKGPRVWRRTDIYDLTRTKEEYSDGIC